MAVSVIRDLCTQMLFAHAAPRKGLAHEQASHEFIKDTLKMGGQGWALHRDGELSLRSVQEEAKGRREAPTVLNNEVGDSQANGAAERAGKALGEVSWMVEHGVGAFAGGYADYERARGQARPHDMVEFGKENHYKWSEGAPESR